MEKITSFLKKIFKTRLGGERGFTLVEIMVAAGLLGVVTLGVMQIMKMITAGQKRANVDLDIAQAMSVITNVFNQRLGCIATLESPAGAAAIASGIKWSAAPAGSWPKKYSNSTQTPIASSSIYSYIVGHAPPQNSYFTISSSPGVYHFGSIKNIRVNRVLMQLRDLLPPTGSQTYIPAEVIIEFAVRNSATASETQIVGKIANANRESFFQKRLGISVVVQSDGTVTDCVQDKQSIIDDVCVALNGVPMVDSTGVRRCGSIQVLTAPPSTFSITASGNLVVTESASIARNLVVGESATVSQNLNVGQSATVTQNLNVGQTMTWGNQGGKLSADGTTVDLAMVGGITAPPAVRFHGGHSPVTTSQISDSGSSLMIASTAPSGKVEIGAPTTTTLSIASTGASLTMNSSDLYSFSSTGANFFKKLHLAEIPDYVWSTDLDVAITKGWFEQALTNQPGLFDTANADAIFAAVLNHSTSSTAGGYQTFRDAILDWLADSAGRSLNSTVTCTSTAAPILKGITYNTASHKYSPNCTNELGCGSTPTSRCTGTVYFTNVDVSGNLLVTGNLCLGGYCRSNWGATGRVYKDFAGYSSTSWIYNYALGMFGAYGSTQSYYIYGFYGGNVYDGNSTYCPDGQFMKGIDARGRILCHPVIADQVVGLAAIVHTSRLVPYCQEWKQVYTYDYRDGWGNLIGAADRQICISWYFGPYHFIHSF